MVNSNFKYDKQTLYDNTNNGLDIIIMYCNDLPNFGKALQNKKKPFKFRESESSASSYLFQRTDNVWFVKDFNGDNHDPIKIAMQKTGLPFYECLEQLYKHFCLGENATFYKPVTEIFTTNLDDIRPDGWYNLQLAATTTNLELVGKHLTVETAAKYGFFSVDFYEKIYTDAKTNEKKILKISATVECPIFAYVHEGWAKLYQPKSQKFKHSYLGKKPERHVYNFDTILATIDTSMIDYLIEEIKKVATTGNDIKKLLQQKEKLMLDSVFIASGGSDGLNLAQLGYNVIWYNSESEQINQKEYATLKKYVKTIYNVPDVDTSGVKYGYQVAENFWNIKSIWLNKDKLGNKGKDFRDWLKLYDYSSLDTIKFEFKKLITGALQLKFFEVSDKNTYTIKSTYLHYFLKVKGFYHVYDRKSTEKSNKLESYFVRIENNIVTHCYVSEIQKFTENYLKNKGVNISVIDLIKNTTLFTESKLAIIDSIELDTKNFTYDTQTFFFKNQFVTVSGTDIKAQNYNDFKGQVWNDKIKDKNIVIQEPYFKYFVDADKNNRIEILNTKCKYLNFLTNGSRTHWRKEFSNFDNNTTDTKFLEYREKNRFNLNSEFLTTQEQITQEQHLLSKCFAIGYLCHRTKIDSFAKLVNVTDDEPKRNENDSNGRSGKSLFFKGLWQLLSAFKVDGRSSNLETNKHALEGYTPENDLLLIEDTAQYFNFNSIYNWITGATPVNPKHGKQYIIEYPDSGKIATTSNYGLGKFDSSTIGRTLFLSFSSYYHLTTENNTFDWQVQDDFDGIDLFSEQWSNEDWSQLYNFLFQCVQLYLNNRHNELKAPMENITINNFKANLGEACIDFLENYFTHDYEIDGETYAGNYNEFILKPTIYKAYKESLSNQNNAKKDFYDLVERYFINKNKIDQNYTYEFNPISENPKGNFEKLKHYKRNHYIGNERTTGHFIYIKATPKFKVIKPEPKKEIIDPETPF